MTSLPIFLRPSVKWQTIDLTQRVQVILSTIGAVVGEFERGPLEPTYLDGTPENFARGYGRVANVSKYGYAHDTVSALMTQSSNALIVRATNSATFGGISVVHDIDRNRWLALPFVAGTSTGQQEGVLPTPVIILSFDSNLVATNQFAMDISNGQTVTAIAPVTYATSNNATLSAIAASILTTLNTFGSGHSVQVYQETSSSNADNRLIIIRPSRSVSLSFSNARVTGGVPPVLRLNDDAVIMDLVSENPGAWNGDYGVKLTSFDTGQRERHLLTINQAFVTANSFSMKINGTTIGPVVYATSSDDTLAAIATAIAANPNIASATVQTLPGPTNNDRSIVIVAKKPGPNMLVLSDALVTLGASQPVVTTALTMRGLAADNTFSIEVYNKADLTRSEERFRVTLNSQIAALGGQLNVEHVVNKASGKSRNIRAILNPDYLVGSVYSATTGDAPTLPANVTYLSGGSDGVKPNSADIRQGWNKIADRVIYPFSVALNAGYTQVSVQKEIVAICEKRGDSIAVLDAPSDKQAAQTLRTYRLEELDIDTSYGAMYSPDVLIEDINTGEQRYIPPSGPIGATYAYSDRLTNYMGAPAGLNRGKVNMALGLRHKYTETDEELLHPVGINCIIDKRGSGPTVMGEETLQMKQTILRNVHARRILNIVKTGLVDGLEYTLFDPNTEYTRNQALQIGDTILKPIKRGGGLIDYRQKCDDDNNTPDVIDNDALAYDVYLKIVRVIKGITVRGILTRTGASFEEIIDEMGGGE